MTRRLFAGSLLAGWPISAAQEKTIKVRVKSQVQELGIEHYTAGVVTGESSVLTSAEARKAMAVAARTYAARFRGRHAPEGFDLCDTTHCQRYDPALPDTRIVLAVKQTTGEILNYQGRPALTYYTLDCGGHGEDVRQVWPGETALYLAGHADPYCRHADRGRWHWEIDAVELAAALQASGLRTPTHITRLTIAGKTASQRAATLALSNGTQTVRLSASSLRFAVGRIFGFNSIQSDLYRVGMAGPRISFDGTGAGHGVGLCQRGADQMGLAGHSYRDILAFYFPHTAISAAASAELTWRRISGERMALFTTQPDHDAPVLAIAESLLHGAETRTHIQAPHGIALRIYPTVAAFIKETGEPGWVAAHVASNEIHLQPRQTLEQRHALESTLRHELTHVLVDSQAKPGLPVWFREGLAEHLSNTGVSNTNTRAPLDRNLRQTADETRARSAYAAGRARVAALVSRYSETTVLSWLSAGLPRETTNASDRPPRTNSK